MGTTQFINSTTHERAWHIVDATDIPLGRLASKVATILRGKHSPKFTTNADAGDFVVVVNAQKVGLTGKKRTDKFYYRHSGYPGGLRQDAYGDLLEKQPTMVIEKAVKGMLPKNTLGRAMHRKLKVYAGSEHPHEAQNPKPLDLK